MMMVTPHLKTVLKDYQHSAVKSLHGPAHHLHPPLSGVAAAAAAAPYEEDACSPTTAAGSSAPAAYVPPLPVQQLPILTTSDTSSSDLSFTPLEDVSISCFSVGGEKRLCLPQVLQSVLGDFTLAQINNQCDNLLIYCSRCTPEQLNVLKGQAILPSSAFSCGLITKSDAERLCSALLYARAKSTSTKIKKEPTTHASYTENNVDAHHPVAKSAPAAVKTEDGGDRCNGARVRPTPRAGGRVFRVRHECFGRAVGVLHEALYDAKQAKCIECVECKGWHSPQQFVKHVHWQHARGESHTVHWGFDSAKWRHYLLPLADAEECCARPLADEADADRVLDLMRDRYEGVAPFAAYEEEKAEIKKEVNGNAVIPPAKEWNMPLKRKLLHQVSKTSPPPRPPPSPPPPIKRDTPSPLFASKKAKLSGEEYMLMTQPYLPPMDHPYVFQQFHLSFPYARPPNALPLGVGHQSAKEAKLRQAIVKSNADLARIPADDPPLPPTPKKQRLIHHHMQEQQRRKLEEVQKSPDSTTVPTTPSTPAERKYSEIDLSTTDTEDTASEGTEAPKAAAVDAPRPPDNDPASPEMQRLFELLALNPHPEKTRIVDMFRRLLDERAARDERIVQLEAQVEALQRRRGRSPARECNAEAAAATGSDEALESTAQGGGGRCEPTPVDEKPVQTDYKSVITSPARNDSEAIQEDDDGGGGGDAATSTSSGDDANPHCPSASAAPAAAAATTT